LWRESWGYNQLVAVDKRQVVADRHRRVEAGCRRIAAIRLTDPARAAQVAWEAQEVEQEATFHRFRRMPRRVHLRHRTLGN